MARGKRILLGAAGVACLVAGLWPDYSTAPAPGGDTTDLRVGLSSSPAYWYHREPFSSADRTTFFGEDVRVEATSISGYRSEWHAGVFSWSAGLIVVGTILVVVGIRRGFSQNS